MNKPVAWMNRDVTSWLSCTNQYPETEIDEWIPLYTHPVKELTDEEIMKVARKTLLNDQLWLDVKIDKDAVEATLDFAKAILRKANEK